MSCDMNGSPPNLCTNLAEVSNSSNSVCSQKDFIELSSQDEELLSILDDLQHNEMPYHPKLKSLYKILSKNLYLLYMNKEVKKVFTPKPMISFRSARKLNNYLVRGKIYPIERILGSEIVVTNAVMFA